MSGALFRAAAAAVVRSDAVLCSVTESAAENYRSFRPEQGPALMAQSLLSQTADFLDCYCELCPPQSQRPCLATDSSSDSAADETAAQTLLESMVV